jgi:hypothetical protein
VEDKDMSEESLRLKVNERSRKKKEEARKKQTRNSLTAQGRGYHLVRSKHVKGKDGYGKLVIEAREKLMDANGGKDPGPDVVAAHYKPGAHFEKGGGKARFLSRGMNTSESNKLRSKKHG